MELKFNRRQFMNRECTYDEYYGQFALHVVPIVRRFADIKRISESKNEHFNDIPLELWYRWSGLVPQRVKNAVAESNASTGGGKFYSPSDMVCVLKAAASVIRGELDPNQG